MAATDFEGLLAGFQALFVELGSRHFDLTWHSVSGECRISEGSLFSGASTIEWTGWTEENPPFDLNERAVIGRLRLPIDDVGEAFTSPTDALTLPKHESYDDARQRFQALSADAGAKLPAVIRDRLAGFVWELNSDPAAWWYALLFYLNGEAAAFEQNGMIQHRRDVTIYRPVLNSVHAVEQLGLNTDRPSWPGVGGAPQAVIEGCHNAALRDTLPNSHAIDSRTYLTAELAREIDISSATLNKYAKRAGVATPRKGQREFRYSDEDRRRILDQFIVSSSEPGLVDRCRALRGAGKSNGNRK